MTGDGYDAGRIPAELERIPAGYTRPATQQGTLERLDYATWESFSYESHTQQLEKTAWVYVPYGYDSTQRYDVLYFSHGGWSNETTTMGTPGHYTSFKNVVDHAIEDGLVRPLLIVLPTYNNTSEGDSGDYGLALQLTINFHNELVGDLMPAVESRYATYADGATPEAFAASREHRAFGGFSMGSVNTWHTFEHCLSYFSKFIVMSGGAGFAPSHLAQVVADAELGADGFFIFGMTGTRDFAHDGFRNQVLSLPNAKPFVLTDSLAGGNVAYRERKGYQHNTKAHDEYTYNGLRLFFNGQARREEEALTASPAYDRSTSISDVTSDPVFGGWGRLIFPVHRGHMGGSTLGNLSLSWYNNIDPSMTVEICNYLHDRAAAGETVFIDIYSEAEKAADPDKADTGLFFFRGNAGARTAIVNAGGGFAYVGAMHDSFPHCLELSRRGYNAFALIYRPGSRTACQDLARAIAYLHEHADELGISMDGYSLWGGSAGARMAAWLGTYGTASFGEASYPRPAMCVVNYTGLSEVTGTEPPTYSAVGTSDWIADYRTMQARIKAIRANGTPAEIEVFRGLSHGFGIGTGTAAEGWLDRAVAFWEENA